MSKRITTISALALLTLVQVQAQETRGSIRGRPYASLNKVIGKSHQQRFRYGDLGSDESEKHSARTQVALLRSFKMRSIVLMAALAWTAFGQQTPVTCVAGARFRVNDLTKAREFYSKVFGFQEKSGTGSEIVAFRINAEQYIEFSPAGSGDSANPLEMIVFGAARKPDAALKDPDGRSIEFLETGAGGRNFKAAGRSVSDHLLHVGMGTADMNRAIDFYGRFGAREIFRRPDFHVLIMRVPGPREDWVEFIRRGEQGSDHICLDVPDIQKAYQTLLERGATIRGKPRIASNGYWVINMTDSNGIRVELMEPHPARK